MDIEAAKARRIEDGPGQKQAIGGDHRDIEAERGEGGLVGRVLQAFGGSDGEAQCLGAELNGGRGEPAAVRRPRRLGVDGRDLVAGGNQGLQRHAGKIRGSHEGNSHGTAVTMDDGLQQLTALVARLPGLGPRSARRVVLQLMKNRETMLQPLLAALARVEASLSDCPVCGNLDTVSPCRICTDPGRDPALLCVVADVADLWALERGRLFAGRYHVLGGTLSAFDGVGPADLHIAALKERVAQGVAEVVLAMNATLEGQTTAHFVAEVLEGTEVRITQLAHGVPVGGELDYLDEGTLAQALRLRRPV